MKVAEITPVLRTRGITQAQLARHLGISRVHMTQLLSGKRRMNVDMMHAIEVFLDDVKKSADRLQGVSETSAVFSHAPAIRSMTLEEARKETRGPRMSSEEREIWLRELRELGEAGKRLPRVTDMTDDEILGYDEME